MKITTEIVEYVAKLARLGLTEAEKEKFTTQLNQILTYAEKLNELDTANVEPTSHVLPLKNVYREDVVRESLPQEKVLNLALEREMGHIKVPRIIE